MRGCLLMKKLLLKQKQVLFFIIAGGLSALVEISCFKMLSIMIPKIFSQEYNLRGIHYPLSNIFSTTLGIIFNYFLSIWFVFQRGKHSKKKEFTYFMLISFLSTVLSLAFFQVFYNQVFFKNYPLILITLSPEIMSKISAIILVSVLNYSLKKNIIFNG